MFDTIDIFAKHLYNIADNEGSSKLSKNWKPGFRTYLHFRVPGGSAYKFSNHLLKYELYYSYYGMVETFFQI